MPWGTRVIEDDNLHPSANIAKLTAGIAVDDLERWPWLAAIKDEGSFTIAQSRDAVVACSYLKGSIEASDARCPKTRSSYYSSAPGNCFLSASGSGRDTSCWIHF